jgi:hypothetical protein
LVNNCWHPHQFKHRAARSKQQAAKGHPKGRAGFLLAQIYAGVLDPAGGTVRIDPEVEENSVENGMVVAPGPTGSGGLRPNAAGEGRR